MSAILHMSSAPEQPGLTITDAARELGIGERRLRRLIERPEYITKTLVVTRQTKTGTRQAVTLSAALLEEIRQLLEIETNAANGDTTSDSDNRGQSDQAEMEPRPARRAGTMTRQEVLLSQVVARQDAEIALLRDQVKSLMDTNRTQSETVAGLTAFMSTLPAAFSALTSLSIAPERRSLWARVSERLQKWGEK